MKHTWNRKRVWITVVALLLLLIFVAGGTIAYFTSKTDTDVNTFVPSKVTCAVEESFDGSVKSNVAIRNTGNVIAYVRATVLVNWVDENDESRVLAIAPIPDTDYSLVFGDSGWVKGGDGFWYYRSALAPQGLTNNLIERAEQLSEAPDGYRLSVQIVATAIQAQPADVVSDEWAVSVSNGLITPNE